MDRKIVYALVAIALVAIIAGMQYQTFKAMYVCTKYFKFLPPSQSSVVKRYVNYLSVVKSPLSGSDYWEWSGSGIAYFDLYIPEAKTQDVILKLTYGKDSASRTHLKVFAFQSEPNVWTASNYAQYLVLGGFVVAYPSEGSSFYEKSIEVRIPKGYPWVRVFIWDSDSSGTYKVRLWVSAFYEYEASSPTKPTPEPQPTPRPIQTPVPIQTPATPIALPQQPQQNFATYMLISTVFMSISIIMTAIILAVRR